MNPLSTKMRAFAATGHERAAELIRLADALVAATDGVFKTPPTHTMAQLVGAWARARRIWCDVTGEPLV